VASCKRLAALAVAAVVLTAPAQAASPRSLDRMVRESGLAGSTSVSVVALDGSVVYEWKGTRARLPASNEKLVTAVAALAELGPSARLHTKVVAVATPEGGVLDGSIWLVGGGDPSLGERDLKRLARMIRGTGITRITGNVLGDESLWDAQRAAPGWKRGFLGEECPPLSALTVARSQARRPALRAAAVLRRALRAAGVRVSGGIGQGTAPFEATEIADDASPLVASLVAKMGKDSDNFIAEMLFKAVAADAYGEGTTAGGARRARGILRRHALALTGTRIVDGSGLSMRNRASSGFIARMLAALSRDAALAAPFRSSLAIAGRDGTLRKRMTSGPAAGVVRAKTGTLNEASALSGYAGPYAFSVLVGGRPVNLTAAHALQDRIAQYLAREA
jgi:serine-type D-Ala-D-Ala carboxypeptidase/endopeptidase (penicillin-binding protein 4)